MDRWKSVGGRAHSDARAGKFSFLEASLLECVLEEDEREAIIGQVVVCVASAFDFQNDF